MSRVGVAEPAYPDTTRCVLGAKHMASESQRWDALVRDYREKSAENHRLAMAGGRTIKARIADDAAHGAGQRLLEYLLRGGGPA